MLHAKFHDHIMTITYVGEDILRVFTIYGWGGHLGHVGWTIYINFLSPFPRRQNLDSIGKAVLEKIFENGSIRVYSAGEGTGSPPSPPPPPGQFFHLHIDSFSQFSLPH